MDELKDAIRRIAGVDYEIYDGFVVAVDQDKMTCDVKVFDSDDSVLKQVALRSVANGEKTGLIAIPTVNAHVVIGKIEGQNDYTLINCSELDKVIVDVGVKVEINAPETVFNDGENGGVPISEKVSERLNNLEKDINDLKQVFSTWTVAPNDGGGALWTNAKAWYGQPLSETKPTDIENEKVKH